MQGEGGWWVWEDIEKTPCILTSPAFKGTTVLNNARLKVITPIERLPVIAIYTGRVTPPPVRIVIISSSYREDHHMYMKDHSTCMYR